MAPIKESGFPCIEGGEKGGGRGREGDPLIVDKEPDINIVGLHKYKTGVLAVFK